MFGIIDMWLRAVGDAERVWRWPVVLSWINRIACFLFVLSQTLGDALRPVLRLNGNLAAFRAMSAQNYVIVALTGGITAIFFLIAGTIIKRRLALFANRSSDQKQLRLVNNVRLSAPSAPYHVFLPLCNSIFHQISNGLVSITAALLLVIILAIVAAVIIVVTAGQVSPFGHIVFFSLQIVARLLELIPVTVVVYFFRGLGKDENSGLSSVSGSSSRK